MFAAVVLAAGASTRFGSPKALIPMGAERAITRACRLLRTTGFQDVVVVVGAHADEIRPAVPSPARIVVNTEWTNGRSGSVKAGVAALDPNADVLVWPIDHPAVAEATLTALQTARGTIRVPTSGGKRGHPTLFEASMRPELIALEDDEPLHDVLHAKPSRVVLVPVPDPGILLNIDTPDDLKKLEGFQRGSRHARAPA